MDSTIEISDSSTNQTIVLDDTDDDKRKNNSSVVEILDSSADDLKDDETSHFVTASTTGKFQMENSPPKVTSTPRLVQIAPRSHDSSTMIFQDVEDEFLHDDSFAEPVEQQPSKIDEDEDSAIESEKTPLNADGTRQKNSNHSQASSSVSDDDDDDDEDDEGENDDSDDESDDDDLEDTHVSVGQMPYSVNFSANHLGNRNIDWDNVSVPETVRILTTKQGAKVIVVGTAHFSEESVKDVTNVMQQFRPDVVVLELCKNRTHILHLDEKTVLAESQNLSAQKIRQTIREYGPVQGLMYVLMLSMSATITKQLGMAPGGEFRAAYQEAQKIPGCLVHLGDRQIEITLKRALSTLSLWQKIKVGTHAILSSNQTITKEDVEKCKQKDLLESLLEELAGEYPEMARVFVDERDTFLAFSLKQAADFPIADGKNQSDPTVVVGVVGIGHLNGIVEKFDTVQGSDVAKLIHVPRPSRSEKYVRLAFRATFWSITAYGIYRLVRGRIIPKFL